MMDVDPVGAIGDGIGEAFAVHEFLTLELVLASYMAGFTYSDARGQCLQGELILRADLLENIEEARTWRRPSISAAVRSSAMAGFALGTRVAASMNRSEPGMVAPHAKPSGIPKASAFS